MGRNSRNTFVTAGKGPAVVQIGRLRLTVRYGDESYFSMGWARTNLTGRWRALSARYFLLISCWPSGFLNNATWIEFKPGDRHQNGYGLGVCTPGSIRQRKTKDVFYLQESVEVPGMGPGESFTGILGRIHTARRLLVKRPRWKAGAIFKRGWQMTSCHVIVGRATPAGCSVTWFASQSQQPPFASANDGTDPVRFNRVTHKCNLGRKPW